jgi:hypothetical protein
MAGQEADDGEAAYGYMMMMLLLLIVMMVVRRRSGVVAV